MLYMAKIPRNNQHARMSHAYAQMLCPKPSSKKAQIQLQQNATYVAKNALKKNFP
jgi:hypothetical protein